MAQPSIFDVKAPNAVWDFRANEDWATAEEIKEQLKVLGKKWSFQLEKGENTGYVHWQGRISLWKKVRGTQLAKLWEAAGLDIPNYCQPSSRNSVGENFYTTKIATRVDGPWTSKDSEAQYVQKRMANVELRGWQQQVVDSVNDTDDRKIDVIIDNTGNNGKSYLALYCHQNKLGISMPPVNDCKELMATLFCILEERQCREPKMIFMDMPRAMGKDKIGQIYSAMERVKDGICQDLRYKYKEWIFEPPKVWVTTNTPPNMGWLSHDRWRIWTITNGRLKPYVSPNLQHEVVMNSIVEATADCQVG